MPTELAAVAAGLVDPQAGDRRLRHVGDVSADMSDAPPPSKDEP